MQVFSLDQELNNTRQDLTTARDQLLTTTEELKNVKVELARTKETLVLAEAAHMNCESTIDGLKSEVKARDEELVRERAQIAELTQKMRSLEIVVNDKEDKLKRYKHFL